jgi:murein DD-endopeptidase MepM/ murein hydrolase activator NlpD
VRATSPPTALPVAAAALALAAAFAVSLAVPTAALAQRWLRPVPGDVARPFSYERAAPFVAGSHRGVDLAAAPAAVVRAACPGRVIHVGAVAGRDQVVSMRCGGRRVSYLPLATVAVRAGATIGAGAPIGSVAPGHRGLHLGVRREGDPFGYEDPMALLPARERPIAPIPVATGRRPIARPATPRPAARPAMPRPAMPRPAARPGVPRPLPRQPRVRQPSPAPLHVWVGLAAALCGAAGSGTLAVRRRRVAHTRVPELAMPP